MKRPFTLIELLVVMAVIGILMGILLPVLSGVKNKGKEIKAKTDMSAILAACKQYESDYGVLPNPQTCSGDWSHLPGALGDESVSLLQGNGYGAFFQILTGIKYGDTSAMQMNIRNLKYLDIPNGYSTKGYVDPWGNTYGIGLDLNYDGQINTDEFTTAGHICHAGGSTAGFNYPGSTTGSGAILSSVAVFSLGSAVTLDSSNKVKSVNANKVLCSWK